MLTQEQSELLDRMRADNQVAGFPFTATPRWQSTNNTFNIWFDKLGIGDVQEQPYNTRFSGLPREARTREFINWMIGSEWAEVACEMLRCKLMKRRRGLSFLRTLPPNSPWDVLTALDTLYTLDDISKILWRSLTVVDLGAGWGRIGYVLKTINKSATYIACDLPESLLVAQDQLGKLLPDEVHPYGELPDGPGIYFLGSQDLPKLDADILINIGSFQEMTEEQIEAYFDIIDQHAKMFYTLQLGSPNKLPYCPARPHWKKLLARHPTWSSLYYEAVFET